MKIHYTSPKEILKKRMGEIKMKIIENMRKKNENNYEKRIR